MIRHLVPRPVVRYIFILRRHLLDIVYKIFHIPLSNVGKVGMEFEELFEELNQNLCEENSFIKQVISEVTDEQVIYKKGEGPEVVFKEGDKLIPRKGTLIMVKYFIAKRLELILNALGNYEHARILDVGATDGLFLRYLQKNEMAINISERAVQYARKHGVESVLGNADDLPFPDKSFDHILCFQTIEHLENPLKALREFIRVCKGKILITIPHTRTTSICPFEFDDRGNHRWHVFEFSHNDFCKILDRVGLKILHYEIIRTAGVPKTFRQKLFVRRWRYHSWFEGFAYYELVPKNNT